jgi:outer membrane protein TolC
LAARQRIASAEASVNVAEAGYYPSLFASLGWGLDKTGPTQSSNGTFSLSFQYPLFEGFRTDEQVQLAQAELTRRKIALRRAELSVRNRIVQAWSRLKGAEQAVIAANRAVDAARENRYAADERYKAGAGSYSDYLTANQRFAEARINQINARFDYRLALFEIDYLAW